jgi:hypothetical protein
MGDISRHRDIFLNTREAIPGELLAKCKLAADDLTYLELGNYLTDVSQFRDPVMYIFSKQRIWRELILPKVADEAMAYRALAAMAALAALGAARAAKEITSGTLEDIASYAGPTLAGAAAIIALLPTDTYADIGGADEWIDLMFGTPLEKIPGGAAETLVNAQKRDTKHYGYVGQFFRHFIEGITQMLFAAEVSNKAEGEWGKLARIPQQRVTDVFEKFFTQYYPHEHTDQPPYVWDASRRPARADWYGPSRRQATLVDPNIGVMNAVDVHYVQYLSEELADVEHEWRKLEDADVGGRQQLLVRLGKLLHGIEDWFFHSNVVELIRLRGHTPAQGPGETSEDFLKRFVEELSKTDPEFKTIADRREIVRLKRRVYRRLRFPAYERGNKKNSGGILSKTRVSTLSLHLAYPAFPSQQDTAHTLLHAMENLERKLHGSGGPPTLEPWMLCAAMKLLTSKDPGAQKLLDQKAAERGTTAAAVMAARAPGVTGPARATSNLVLFDIMREWLPLVVTLLSESERQRLVANVHHLKWPPGNGVTVGPEAGPRGPEETDRQLDRHKLALEPKLNVDGRHENNYERAARYVVECGYLNVSGRNALVAAFQVDQKSQKILEGAPGSGGFLIKFAIELQRALDDGDVATEILNKKEASIHEQVSDNGAFNEIIGSHSLMSKDTLTSPPFFDDAKVLASVASSSVFHIMLEQVSAPASDRRLPWKAILHYLIRYPVKTGGWERRALAFFRDPKNKAHPIPRFADLPELSRLVTTALASKEASTPWSEGVKDEELKQLYIQLELEVSKYRYP